MNDINYFASTFIAETRSGSPMPVFFDPHTAIYNAGRPVTTITGSPGQGKTFAGQLITTVSAMMGKTVIALDYKGDMLRIGLLEKELGVPITIWNIADSRQKGILDPYNMSNDIGEQLNSVIEVIDLFIGGLTRDDRQAILPIIRDVTEDKNPTLMRVVRALKISQNKIAQGVGSELDAIRHMPYASVCFHQGTERKKPPKITDGGLTIATLAGMDLPSDAEQAKSSNAGRLASGILYLLTDYIRRLLAAAEVKRPKLLVIDEAWAVLATPAGVKIIKEVALLGRSKNIATLLITQSPDHLADAKIENTIGNRFSFSVSDDEAVTLVKSMKLPEDQGFEGLLSALPKRICMMSDYKNDYDVIEFTTWREDWLRAFNTNPYEVMEEEKAKRAKNKNS